MPGLVRLLMVVLGFVLLTSPTHSQDSGPPEAIESSGPQPPVTAYNGSFTQSLSILVPAFRGLEPKLALSYDSARGIRNNAGGWLGVGWSISGLSAIERVSGAIGNDPNRSGGRGSPSYGAAGMPADRFVLDGEELIACTASIAASPSCAAGGTHAAFVENYQRIVQNTGSNSWTVTARDGTAYTYHAVEAGVTAVTTFRWMLSSVQDRYGNRVEYTNVCEAGAQLDCYLDNITYKNAGSTTVIATICLHRETRPDVISFATGKGLGRITKRIRSISVMWGASLVRAYALTYDFGAATKLSRLVSVREYGRDVVIDTAGVISGGSSLPPNVFSYSEAPTSFATQNSPIAAPEPPNFSLNLTMGDFNGDGRVDAVSTRRWQSDPQVYKCEVNLRLSDSGGLGRPQAVLTAGSASGSCNNINLIAVADFTGDGADDIALSYTVMKKSPNPNLPPTPTTTRKVYSWNGTNLDGQGGSYPEHQTAAKITGRGDFNGDGKEELLFRDGTILFVSSSGQFTVPSWGAVAPVNESRLSIADFNGDGRSDIIQLWRETDGLHSVIYLSNGSTLLAMPEQDWAPFNIDSRSVSYGDINGDGRADAIIFDDPSDGVANARIRSVLSNGKSLELANAQSVTITLVSGVGLTGLSQAITGDFNGDGRIDVLLPYDGSFLGSIHLKYWVVLSIGETFSAGPYTPNAGWRVDYPIVWGDFTGDGRTELLVNDEPTVDMAYVDGPQPDLLIQLVNPTGGKTTVTYGVSSEASNTKLPFIMHTVDLITYDDNRGWSSLTEFRYEEGTWNKIDRTFMGFRQVRADLPCNAGETTCPETLTTFRQDIASLGKWSAIESFHGNTTSGTLLRTETNNYTIDTSAPFISQLSSSVTVDKLGSQTKTRRSEYTYDNHDNLTIDKRFGDETATGDERTDAFTFYPHLANFVVNCTAQKRTFSSIGTGGLTSSHCGYGLFLRRELLAYGTALNLRAVGRARVGSPAPPTPASESMMRAAISVPAISMSIIPRLPILFGRNSAMTR